MHYLLGLMKKMKRYIQLIIITLLIIKCNEETPTQYQNNSPEILSLNIFPSHVHPKDSFFVFCDAIDPDGDTLVYDWLQSGLLKIKGTDWPYLYHQSENFQVFFAPDTIYAQLDTFWVKCGVRDVKGGGDIELVYVYVSKEIE